MSIPNLIQQVNKNTLLSMEGSRWEDWLDVYGFNPAVGTSEEPIWAQSGTAYPYIDSAANMTISSSSASDASGNTGLRTVLVESLDDNFVFQTEVATLNGQTAVNLTKPIRRILKVTGITAGNTGSNVGVVRVGTGAVTGGVPAVPHCHMVAGVNTTLLGFTTVPAGKTAYITSVVAHTSASGEIRLYIREFGGLFILRRRLVTADSYNYPHSIYIKVPEKSDIVFRGIADLNTIKASVAFEGYLI